MHQEIKTTSMLPHLGEQPIEIGFPLHVSAAQGSRQVLPQAMLLALPGSARWDCQHGTFATISGKAPDCRANFACSTGLIGRPRSDGAQAVPQDIVSIRS